MERQGSPTVGKTDATFAYSANLKAKSETLIPKGRRKFRLDGPRTVAKTMIKSSNVNLSRPRWRSFAYTRKLVARISSGMGTV